MLTFARKRSTTYTANNSYGFSLVELLVVVAILAILAAIAIPIFLNQKNKAKTATVESDMHNAIMEMQALKPATGSFVSSPTLQTSVNASGYKKTGTNSIQMYSDCKFGAGATLVSLPGDFIVTGFVNNGSGGAINGTGGYQYDSATSTWENFVWNQTSGAHWGTQWTSVPGTCAQIAAY